MRGGLVIGERGFGEQGLSENCRHKGCLECGLPSASAYICDSRATYNNNVLNNGRQGITCRRHRFQYQFQRMARTICISTGILRQRDFRPDGIWEERTLLRTTLTFPFVPLDSSLCRLSLSSPGLHSVPPSLHQILSCFKPSLFAFNLAFVSSTMPKVPRQVSLTRSPVGSPHPNPNWPYPTSSECVPRP